MHAAVVTDFGGPEVVRIVETSVPEPGDGQVRIKVAAAALNPADVAVRAGLVGQADTALGLGWDVAGRIDAVGASADWAVDDEVVALAAGLMKPPGRGTHAEYVIVDATAVAPAPTSVDPLHAATLPLNSLTALQTLNAAGLEKGQTLLVTGAAGAVGGYAVQLAAHRGIEVTALAGPADEDLVRQFGASHFVPRGGVVGRHDAVLDTVPLPDTALDWVRDGGTYVSTVPTFLPTPAREIQIRPVIVTANGAQLKDLVSLVDAGALTTRVADTYPLAEAAKAHARLADGGLRGRLVLVP
ncbi:NADP-dependent oxidoreductase [Streptacidiphilus neutrinimicus]|uniref:NADP-dependent oxidoreductase n=1 Tax=Streptacidiphilus neutrinimicus TaxID=105420 RepID=UPI0005A76CA2|nr:NADP-dependent oxidoreductase [Streptacidiphilus neutrinimicus]